MKIAQKLTLCLVAVTGALFLVGGYRMVSQNFEASLEQAAAQNAAQHTAQRLSRTDFCITSPPRSRAYKTKKPIKITGFL